MGYSRRYYRCGSSPLSDIEITPREIIFSIFIVGILYAIGFLISGVIEKDSDEENLRYRQAIQIADSGIELRQACETDVGDAFVEGDFKAIDPVCWDGLDGEYLSIVRDEERYTMHTRTVVVTDSKGRSHTKIEHYWTWDVVDSKSKHASRVSFCGNTYGYETFGYSCVGRGSRIVSAGFHRRYVFHYKDKEFRGTIFASLRDGTICGRPNVEMTTIEELLKYKTTHYFGVFFWIIWWLIIGGAVFGFVALENRWLENKEKATNDNSNSWRYR